MRWPFFRKLNLTPEEFWIWFAKHMATVSSREMSQRLATQISSHLKAVHEDIAWGISFGEDGEPNTIEISADGLKELIPIVLEIVKVAPDMPRWRVAAFRQPESNFSLKMRGQSVDSTTVLCHPIPIGDGRHHLYLYLPLPADAKKDDLIHVGFLVLDHVLGEYVVMTRLGDIEFESVLAAPPEAIPLMEFKRSVLPN